MEAQQSFKWVEVLRFSSEQEAEFCRALLETEGVPVRIHNGIFNRNYPGASFATGGVQLLVPDKDVLKSSVVLERGGYLVAESQMDSGWDPDKLRKWVIISLIVATLAIVAALLIVSL